MQKYRPEGQYFRNLPPYHTLYVISYGDSEAQKVHEGLTTNGGRDVPRYYVCGWVM